MKKLSDSAYKAIKIIHIVSSSVWIGAAVVGLFLLNAVLNKNNLREILLAVHYLDLLIIIPANCLTLITGIIFSTCAGWGFFRHTWITLKYGINLIPIVLGGIVFAPSIINMLSIVDTMGAEAIADASFIKSKIIFTGAFALTLVLLIMAVCFTVIKPKFKKHH
jgi:uncharacterized membrane protein